MSAARYLIVRHGGLGAALPAEPIAGRYYFGVHENGEVGALARWNGYAFESSGSDDVNMAIYAHLQEQPPRG